MLELMNKNKVKRFGVFLIIIGAFIPSILYPFLSLSYQASFAKVSLSMRGVSYDTSIRDFEISIVKGEWKEGNKNTRGHYEGRFAIPYKYIVSFGILLAFAGICIVAFHKDRMETG